MNNFVFRKGLVIGIIILFVGACFLPNIITTKVCANKFNEIEIMLLNGPPFPPIDTSDTIVDKEVVLKEYSSAVILDNVPTSRWTYGCGPTAAGMLFGYYDRKGFKNMYTGPANGGICPQVNLGQGTPGQGNGYPIEGSCHIIATEKDLDGITSKAHVDDYWTAVGSPGPDPWDGNWAEHSWDLCLADFIGSNQWKWDNNGDGSKDCNADGATRYFYNSEGEKLDDFIPPAWQGYPRTAFCHGLKLFAESRGYTVIDNYNQLTDTPYGHPSGFTYNDFKNEINAGRPVITGWLTSYGAGHSMLGVGYNPTSNTIYFHDTWDNYLHEVSWDGSYADLHLSIVFVVKLASSGTQCPNVPSKPVGPTTCFIDEEYTFSTSTVDPDGDQVSYGWDWNDNGVVDEWTSYFPSGSTASISHTWSSPGTFTFKVKAKDVHDAMSDWSDSLTVNVNGPPGKTFIHGETSGSAGTSYVYGFRATDPDDDDIAQYIVDWGDDTGEEILTGPFPSGEYAYASHIWVEEGYYIITAKAKDINGLIGPEGTLPVNMPKNKAINAPFLNFLTSHPNLFPILQQLLLRLGL